ncbi:MAG TPA: hypothetical protein VHI54_10425 [Actinomycetota bacterium]|nr:hypothetical protein [Actinomycetota bacterium]
MGLFKNLLKNLLPERYIESYRRRRAVRAYMRSLSHEIYDRQKQLRIEELEGKILARRPSLTHRLMKDLLDRMDVVMEGFHRQLEGLRARHGTELRELREEVQNLRASVEALRRDLEQAEGDATSTPAFRSGEGAERREAPAALTQAME